MEKKSVQRKKEISYADMAINIKSNLAVGVFGTPHYYALFFEVAKTMYLSEVAGCFSNMEGFGSVYLEHVKNGILKRLRSLNYPFVPESFCFNPYRISPFCGGRTHYISGEYLSFNPDELPF